MTDDDSASQGHSGSLPEEAIRELLHDARVDQPVPNHVIARLDATLVSLAPAPGQAQSGPQTRHKRGPLLLLAAASVAVIGVGVGLVNQIQPTQDAAPSTIAGKASEEAPSQESYGAAVASGNEPSDQALATATLPVVRPAHFVRDAQSALAQPMAAKRATSADSTQSLDSEPSAPPTPSPEVRQTAGCADQVVKPGERTVLVTFKKSTVRLVLTSDRTLRLYACDGSQLLQRSAP